jgi:general stress protein 26
MKPELRKKIFEILDDNRLMTVATNRPDGWPQATTVGFANDGLDLLFLCGPDSQKAKNLARDDRVSVTIDHDIKDPMKIAGLSLAGHAQPVTGMKEVERFYEMLGRKISRIRCFPEAGSQPGQGVSRAPDRDLGARLHQGFCTHRSGGSEGNGPGSIRLLANAQPVVYQTGSSLCIEEPCEGGARAT